MLLFLLMPWLTPLHAQLSLVPLDHSWRYFEGDEAPGEDWASREFDDSSWAEGQALFGYEIVELAEPIRTPLEPYRVAHYFRTTFANPFDVEVEVDLLLSTFIDDGLVVYLNGEEIYRRRLPTGPIAADTLTLEYVDDAGWEGPFLLPRIGLRAGMNTLAAELHQVSWVSSDAIFGMALSANGEGRPVIGRSPISRAAPPGGEVTFDFILSSGRPPFTYQWYFDGVAMEGGGATQQSLTLSQLTAEREGAYHVEVRNALGQATSNPAQLVVTQEPVIVEEPADTEVREGFSARFSVGAGGSEPLQVQWFFQNEPVPGGTAATLYLPQVRAADQGEYHVIVSNALASATSRLAALAVLPPTLGSADRFFQSGAGPQLGSIRSLAVQPDGKVVVGGEFRQWNGQPRAGVTRLNIDGSLDESFDPGEGPDGPVQSLGLAADGRIYLGGFFGNVGGVPRVHGLARLEPDGTLDSTFEIPDGQNGYVYTLAVQSDGKLVVGGWIGLDGVSTNRVLRLLEDGRLDPEFGGGLTFDRSIFSVDIQADGSILAGGLFNQVNGIARRALARCLADGTVDPDFAPIRSSEHFVRVVSSQSDGSILLGGEFPVTPYGLIRDLIRVVPTGSIDPDYQAQFGSETSGERGLVLALAALPGGDVLVGGLFDIVEGVSRPNVARLHSDGRVNLEWNPGSGADSQVHALAVAPTGEALVGGMFRGVDGWYSPGVARLHGGGLGPFIGTHPRSMTVDAGDFTQLEVSLKLGTAPVDYQWFRLEGGPVEGGTQALLPFDAIQPDQAGTFYVVVSNPFGQATSAPAELLVLTDPQVVFQPADLLLPAGAEATFRVEVVGAIPRAYQWYRQGMPIAGALDAVLRIQSVGAEDEGDYHVVVGNAYGQTVSQAARLELLAPPSIVRQPQSIEVVDGGTAVFSVQTLGTRPLTYRWRHGVRNLALRHSDQRTDLFVIDHIDPTHAGIYTVVISNAVSFQPGVLSDGAILTVLSDADDDGMPDTWEEAHDLSPQDASDAFSDEDRDGVSNREEYEAGTDPLDPSSYLSVQSIETRGSVILTFRAAAAKTYAVEYRDVLGLGGWARLRNVAATEEERLEIVEDPGPFAGRRFYRLASPARSDP